MPPLEEPTTILANRKPPPATEELRNGLAAFLNRPLADFVNDAPLDGRGRSISVGAVKWGAYAFFDYDGQPIYVGQTRESLGTRIRRHLTNQRTDAVAMAVLDPFEVRSIRVWPLHQYQSVKGRPTPGTPARSAADHLNGIERAIFDELIAARLPVLNEKDPPQVAPRELPRHIEEDIVSSEVLRIRQHPDTRIARRAHTLARLSGIVASREVAGGLRRALLTQADRLSLLARQRFEALGGRSSVEARAVDEAPERDLDEEEVLKS